MVEEVLLSSFSPDESLIPTKWVLSVKTKADGSHKGKALVVACGFEGAEKERMFRDSPTASNATQRLLFQLLAERQRLLQSWDFLSTFLREKWL